MATKTRPMSLTDDDVHTLIASDGRRVAVRLRAWREEGRRPFVLAEAAGEVPISPHACKIMTFIHHCLLKGEEGVYLEHEGDAWRVITFAWVRHAATSPYRKALERADIEAVIGAAIPA